MPEPPTVAPQPMLVVADVAASSRWYARVLGLANQHEGDEYRRLLADGVLVLQLHAREEAHHHGPLLDPSRAVGNGVLVWFAVAAFDAAVAAARAAGAHVVTDVHVNPNARQRELWLRDPDGYLVVLAEATGTATARADAQAGPSSETA